MVEVVVDLAETHITTADLIGLRVGDIITTEKDVAAAAGGVDRGPAEVPRRGGRVQRPQGDSGDESIGGRRSCTRLQRMTTQQ